MSIRDRIRWRARRIRALARQLEPVAPLLTRLVLGCAFLRTGVGKLAHLPAAIDYFGEVGIPWAPASAVAVSALELIGGVMLCVGLWTRTFAALLSCTMMVAALTADRAQLFAAFAMGSDHGPTEVVPLLFLLFLLWLVADGGGLVSLDRLLARARPQIGDAEAALVRRRTEQAIAAARSRT